MFSNMKLDEELRIDHALPSKTGLGSLLKGKGKPLEEIPPQ